MTRGTNDVEDSPTSTSTTTTSLSLELVDSSKKVLLGSLSMSDDGNEVNINSSERDDDDDDDDEDKDEITKLKEEKNVLSKQLHVLERFVDEVTGDGSYSPHEAKEAFDARKASPTPPISSPSTATNKEHKSILFPSSYTTKNFNTTNNHTYPPPITTPKRNFVTKSLRNIPSSLSIRQTKFSSLRYRKKLGEKFESFDYDCPVFDDSSVDDDGACKGKGGSSSVTTPGNSGSDSGTKNDKEDQKRLYFKWLYVFLIGVVTGSISYYMTVSVGVLNRIKWDHTWNYLENGHTFKAYIYYITFISTLIALAALLGYWSPEAAGSGIPQVKAYLNGVNLAGIMKMRTLVAKVLGITFCVASGMPAGREGPMVHSGAIIGAGLARGYSDQTSIIPGLYTGFDNARDRRDYVSMGAAAGVAAAFNAPIGAILFSLEEVSSFWSPSLTWTTFICAIISSYTLNFFLASQGSIKDEGLVLFGHSNTGDSDYLYWEVPLFVIISAAGGVIGGMFNWINERITIWRKAVFGGRSRGWRAVECVALIMVLLSVFFFLPMAFECKPLSDFITSYDDESSHTVHPIRYTCDSNSYNELATLLLTPQETTILQLYSRETQGYFSIPVLLLFFVVYFCSSVTAYGLVVPAGLFIPSMIIGASFGRLCGELIHLHISSLVDPGMYALIGAASVLGGVTRMTISLTVIMVEISNDINLLLPIMLALAVSKVVGGWFSKSLYDVHMELAGVPYLESDPLTAFSALYASDVMSTNLVTITKTETKNGHGVSEAKDDCSVSVSNIERCLSTKHNAFPVVDCGKYGVNCFFDGVITREALDSILTAHNKSKSKSNSNAEQTETETEAMIDIHHKIHKSPFVVQQTFDLPRTLRLFNGMGLRHIIVIDERNRLCGVITRKDFLNLHSSCGGGGGGKVGNGGRNGGSARERERSGSAGGEFQGTNEF